MVIAKWLKGRRERKLAENPVRCIIDGKLYSTKNAALILEYMEYLPPDASSKEYRRLYRTQKGSYFVLIRWKAIEALNMHRARAICIAHGNDTNTCIETCRQVRDLFDYEVEVA